MARKIQRSLLLLVAAACGLLGAPAAFAVPGPPQAPVPLYSEGFENGPPTSPILISAYLGPPPAVQTYTANPAWITDTGCNGVVTSLASGDLTPCSANAGLESLTAALGTFNGTSAANNHAWASMTTNSPAADLVELETVSPIAVGAPSRFVAVSVNVSATTCTTAAPL